MKEGLRNYLPCIIKINLSRKFLSVVGCDLAIMVDASSGLGGKENAKLLFNFVTAVFHSFDINSGETRYALVRFGKTAEVWIKSNFVFF